MKKIITILFVMLLIASFAIAEEKPFTLPEGIAWGDSTETVLANTNSDSEIAEWGYLSLLERDNVTIDGIEAKMIYLFYHDKLVAMGYSFSSDVLSVEAIVEGMNSVYGDLRDLSVDRLTNITTMMNPDFTMTDEEAQGCYEHDDSSGVYTVVLTENYNTEVIMFAENLIQEIHETVGYEELPTSIPAVVSDPAEEAETEGSDVFRITFQFNEDTENIKQAEENLRRINEVLNGLALSNLSIENDRAYTSALISHDDDGKVESIEYQYGFSQLTLVCEQKEDAERKHFQIETAVDSNGEFDTESFHDYWCEQHPDRIMRAQVCRSGIAGDVFDIENVFIVIHCER